MAIVRQSDLFVFSPSTYLENKTSRAKEHLDEIDSRLAKVFDLEPYTVTRKDYPKKFKHVIRVEAKPIPIEIAMLIGEFVYCLRSGLDQLAWRLARLNTPCPARATSFPIRDTPGSGLGDAVKDILPAAVTIIESLQPYHRGARFKDHPLWILNRLSTIEKHRTLAITAMSFGGSFPEISPSEIMRKDLDYGAEFSVPLSRNKTQFNPRPPDIIIGEPIPGCYGLFEIPLTRLHAIHDFVRDDVIPRFAGFK